MNEKTNVTNTNESFGTGLENLKSRYELLSDKKVIVLNSDKKFHVSIPIIGLSD